MSSHEHFPGVTSVSVPFFLTAKSNQVIHGIYLEFKFTDINVCRGEQSAHLCCTFDNLIQT